MPQEPGHPSRGVWNRGFTSRRRLLGAGAAMVSGTVLVACGGHRAGNGHQGSRSAALPSTSFSGITLTLTPNVGQVPFNSTLVRLLEQAVQPFLAVTPGVRVRFLPGPSTRTLVAENLAGTAPDISGGPPAPLLAADAALDLTSYVRRDNVDLAAFGAGRLSVWQYRGGLYALPSDNNAYGMIINLTELNQRGLTAPPKNWTSVEAARLFSAATHTDPQTGRVVAGGAVMCYREGVPMPESFYLYGFGAAYASPDDPAICTLGTSQAIEAGNWVYSQLVNGTATNIRSCFPQNLAAGSTMCDGFGLCAMIQTAQQLRGFEWDFWPMPTFPKGLFTHAGSDGYIILSQTKHPEQAWELLKWMTTEPDWQEFTMKTSLLAPFSLNLWDQYVTVVGQVAPPMATKDLGVLRDMGTFVLDSNFKYAIPQTLSIMGNVGSQLLTGKLSVDKGFPLIADQINAVETAQGTASA